MNIDAKKSAFMIWLIENRVFADHHEIVEKAAEIFGASFSKKVRREANGEMTKLQREVLDIMSSGNWYTDYDIAALIGKSEATAGARRRDLRKFGYRVVPQQNGGVWRYRIVFDSPRASDPPASAPQTGAELQGAVENIGTTADQ